MERRAILNAKMRIEANGEKWFELWIEGFGRNVFPQGYETQLKDQFNALSWFCEMERVAVDNEILTVRNYIGFESLIYGNDRR